MLQAARSRVQVPMRSLVFLFNLPYTLNRTMALGLTQLLTEMSTTNLVRGKERQACKSDDLIAICENRLSRQC
jgi:hypothetical protein